MNVFFKLLGMLGDLALVAYWLTFYYAQLLPDPYDCQCEALITASQEHILTVTGFFETYNWVFPFAAYWTGLRMGRYLLEWNFSIILAIIFLLKSLYLVGMTLLNLFIEIIELFFVSSESMMLKDIVYLVGLAFWVPAVIATGFWYIRNNSQSNIELISCSQEQP